MSAITGRLERAIFGNRRALLAVFALVTAAMLAVLVRGLHIDASFTKQLPLRHEYMQTFVKHQADFGGANRVLIALIARDGNMFTPEFFAALRDATDAVLVMDGIDRGRVQSLFTPNVRYIEVVEDGIEAGNVVDAEFQPTPEALAQVRENILKAGIVGRLVANDFSGALISAIVLETDANGRPVDPIAVAERLEREVRDAIQGRGVDVATAPSTVDVHMIGFAKVVHDIAQGALSVVVFAVVTLIMTLLAVWFYCQSFRIALIPVVCSVIAVTWQLGTLTLLGYGIDPLGLLVPFVIFAIGVSHGVQQISAVTDGVLQGLDPEGAARGAFRALLVPAIVALVSDLVGFVTILYIPVQVIQEMAVTASIGVAVVILTNLVLLPLLVSAARFDPDYRARIARRRDVLGRVWDRLAVLGERGPALALVAFAVVLGVAGFVKGRESVIGDQNEGVPELRPDSRYNIDSRAITSSFSIGVDILTVIVETREPACVSHELMKGIDDFSWEMQNVAGVQDVISLPYVAKQAIAGWSEGALPWREIPRNADQLAQSTRYIETSTGLLNAECTIVPVMLFLADHKAETIERVVAAVKRWRSENPLPGAELRLATGNVGVMAATNEEVKRTEFPILFGVFAAVALMCALTFRSLTGTALVMLPLMLVSVLAYALMATVGIGLKVTTLPMVALGVGIGVDYGIYLFSRMQQSLRAGLDVRGAFRDTLQVTGASVIFTGLTLAIGVSTWMLSPLQFQADIGTLLAFMFFVNMIAALTLIPALAALLIRRPPAASPPGASASATGPGRGGLAVAVMVGLFFAATPGGAQQRDFASIDYRTERVTEQLYMLSTPVGGNVAVLIGDDGAVLIDDQFDELAPKLRAAVAQLTDKPIRFVINTHWHFDHTGGNAALGRSGTVIVAHGKVRERMSTTQVGTLSGLPTPPSPREALPIVTFDQAVTLHLNDEDLEVTHVASAHTDGDAIIRFRKANVVHLGDVFFVGSYPFIDTHSGGSYEGLLAALAQTLAGIDDQTRVIPGHGPLADKAKLREFHAMLTTIRDRIVAQIRAGKTLAEVVAAKPTAEFDAEWAGSFWKPDQWVARSYTDLRRSHGPR
jgi:predicted RND superfamily exporter protein/glyoxylase-like metal-dependent hydrolase (beta-lactamase superfamily II)